jgi:hypothetical protein
MESKDIRIEIDSQNNCAWLLWAGNKIKLKDLKIHAAPPTKPAYLSVIQEAINLQAQGFKLTSIIELFQVRSGKDLPVFSPIGFPIASKESEIAHIAFDSLKEVQEYRADKWFPQVFEKVPYADNLERDGIDISLVKRVLEKIGQAYQIASFRERWARLKKRESGRIYKLKGRYQFILQQIKNGHPLADSTITKIIQDAILPQDIIVKIKDGILLDDIIPQIEDLCNFLGKVIPSMEELESWNSEYVKGNDPRNWDIWNLAILWLIDEFKRVGYSEWKASDLLSEILDHSFGNLLPRSLLVPKNIRDRYNNHKPQNSF